MNQIVNYDAEWAKAAQAYAERERLQGGTFLSVKGGILSYGDVEMPGNQACVIVLDSVYEKTYYGQTYDPDNAAAPVCYSFANDPDEVTGPHISMKTDLSYFHPQSSLCKDCPHNIFGTAEKGKGKACQDRRRLALIPAGYYAKPAGSRELNLQLFTDPKHFQTAEIAFIKLPVMSVKGWSKYVTQLTSSMNIPPFAAITRLFIEPDTKAQYKVHFEVIDKLPVELAPIIMARVAEAQKSIITGYKPPEAKPAAPQGSLRGLRR